MLLALMIAGCAEPAEDPCAPMCAAAASLYGACLEDWGADWAAAGYADGADFQDACETWAWEQRLLEDEAGQQGVVDATCLEREALFTEGTCEDFTAVDWSAALW